MLQVVLWWIVTDLFLLSNTENVALKFLWSTLKARSCRLFIRLFIFLLWNIHINWQYPNWEQINAFTIDLRCARFIYCATLVRAFSFREVFSHKEATWSSKRELLLKRIPSSFWFPRSFWFKLLLIFSFHTLILILSVCFKIVVWKPVKKFICISF